MARYFAELGPGSIVLRVIVCDDPDWPATQLGGTWVETADPYAEPGEARYAGIGHGYDPDAPERFAPAWRQPELPEDAYPDGAIAFRDGRIWRSRIPVNDRVPGRDDEWSPPSQARNT